MRLLQRLQFLNSSVFAVMQSWALLTTELCDDGLQAPYHLISLQSLLASTQTQVQHQEEKESSGIQELYTRTVEVKTEDHSYEWKIKEYSDEISLIMVDEGDTFLNYLAVLNIFNAN